MKDKSSHGRFLARLAAIVVATSSPTTFAEAGISCIIRQGEPTTWVSSAFMDIAPFDSCTGARAMCDGEAFELFDSRDFTRDFFEFARFRSDDPIGLHVIIK